MGAVAAGLAVRPLEHVARRTCKGDDEESLTRAALPKMNPGALVARELTVPPPQDAARGCTTGSPPPVADNTVGHERDAQLTDPKQAKRAKQRKKKKRNGTSRSASLGTGAAAKKKGEETIAACDCLPSRCVFVNALGCVYTSK